MSYLKDKIELQAAEAQLNVEESLAQYPPFYKWVLVLGTIAIIPAYFITKKISYSLWTRSFQAHLIAAKPSFESPQPIHVGKAHFSSYGDGLYSVAVEVNNENLDLTLNDVPYLLQLFNDKNEVVYSENKRTFFLPNDKKYIIVPKISTKDKIVSTVVTFPDNLPWQKRLNVPKVEIATTKPRVENKFDPIGFEVGGSFTNRSPYQLGNIRINTILFNSKNEVIASSYHEAQSVKPFETRDYKLIWPGVHSSNTDFVYVYAETNPLQPGNLQLPAPENNPASNLNRD